MEKEKAKNVRRAAKGNLTRTLNAGSQLLEAKRPLQEVRDAFQEVKVAHTDLVAKHEAYTMFLNDEEYTEAETWMDDCTCNSVGCRWRPTVRFWVDFVAGKRKIWLTAEAISIPTHFAIARFKNCKF